MSDTVRVKLQPSNKTLTLERGTPLHDVLFEHGVEFPCGGHGVCGGCKIKILEGDAPVTKDDKAKLSESELTNGRRLACCCTADIDMTIELEQWETRILSDETYAGAGVGNGLGVAVDIGSTTLVAQLLDLSTGDVLAVETSLNPQAKHGADIMSRVEFAMSTHGMNTLTNEIRRSVYEMLLRLYDSAERHDENIASVVLVGNTVMHHLFCGIHPSALSRYPFETQHGGMKNFSPNDIGWALPGNPEIIFMPCIGGFVGSDILAGIIATGVLDSDRLSVLVDLGTNGEIAIGNNDRIICASTAAGPAFEGARISMGMRAVSGAISEVITEHNGFKCKVLGGVKPRGICGSGLVDAVSAGLHLNRIHPSGRLNTNGNQFHLCGEVQVTQTDVRELQLAKGAIAAGIQIILRKIDAGYEDIENILLAGAFGNYVNPESACRIGLFPFAPDKIIPAGNAALKGAKRILMTELWKLEQFEGIREKISQVALGSDPEFQDIFMSAMAFPHTHQIA